MISEFPAKQHWQVAKGHCGDAATHAATLVQGVQQVRWDHGDLQALRMILGFNKLLKWIGGWVNGSEIPIYKGPISH